ncbi:hypothetical protein OV079_18090 [Nannocystis pusilla]|uniref:Uncharacterized protein n=1 Tax=Nannocystis pusilla TaxID=889268 RepID=A0A9X3EQK0_9BACT|nr:hypothetical protein [Nannocystis pusilla]MCY1007425.1 hypothetical protein [Nannocystis pusilla]
MPTSGAGARGALACGCGRDCSALRTSGRDSACRVTGGWAGRCAWVTGR